MKKLLTRLAAVGLVSIGLFGTAASAYAIDTWHIDTERGGVDHTPYNIDDPATGQDHVMVWDITAGYQGWLNPARFESEFMDNYYDYVHATTLSAATSTLNIEIDTVQAEINNLTSAGSFSLPLFMANQSSTTPLVATSTFNGFMSGAMVTKLNSLQVISTSTPAATSTNRTLNTCFQVSSAKDAFVSYSVDVDSTVTLAGGAVGQVALTTYTDAGCTTNAIVVSKGKAGLTGTLVVGLTLNNPSTLTLGGVVTRGLYAKLVTTNVTGTPTFTMNTTQEVTGNLTQ